MRFELVVAPARWISAQEQEQEQEKVQEQEQEQVQHRG